MTCEEPCSTMSYIYCWNTTWNFFFVETRIVNIIHLAKNSLVIWRNWGVWTVSKQAHIQKCGLLSRIQTKVYLDQNRFTHPLKYYHQLLKMFKKGKVGLNKDRPIKIHFLIASSYKRRVWWDFWNWVEFWYRIVTRRSRSRLVFN